MAGFDESGLVPASLPAEELAAHVKLTNEFRQLGFTVTEAGLMAAAGVEPWQAKHLLRKGCSHKWAALILI